MILEKLKNYWGFSSPFIEERLYFLPCVVIHHRTHMVLVPFYRGAVVFMELHNKNLPKLGVLVPFYRGAVVFKYGDCGDSYRAVCSRPLLSRSGCISMGCSNPVFTFQSSRPLLSRSGCIFTKNYYKQIIAQVLVPFYRGAVVFIETIATEFVETEQFSSPFIEERLYLTFDFETGKRVGLFSSPFIEERLYL